MPTSDQNYELTTDLKNSTSPADFKCKLLSMLTDVLSRIEKVAQSVPYMICEKRGSRRIVPWHSQEQSINEIIKQVASLPTSNDGPYGTRAFIRAISAAENLFYEQQSLYSDVSRSSQLEHEDLLSLEGQAELSLNAARTAGHFSDLAKQLGRQARELGTLRSHLAGWSDVASESLSFFSKHQSDDWINVIGLQKCTSVSDIKDALGEYFVWEFTDIETIKDELAEAEEFVDFGPFTRRLVLDLFESVGHAREVIESIPPDVEVGSALVLKKMGALLDLAKRGLFVRVRIARAIGMAKHNGELRDARRVMNEVRLEKGWHSLRVELWEYDCEYLQMLVCELEDFLAYWKDSQEDAVTASGDSVEA